MLASEVTNPGRVQEWGSHVVKSLTFFLSFLFLYYVIATTIRSRESVLVLLRLLTGGGTVVAILAILERRTDFNVFDHLSGAIPFLAFQGQYGALMRGGNLRVLGPAEHPIALGAMLIMLFPIAIYLARISGRRWTIAAVLLVLGALATGSRTAVVMLVAEVIVFLVVKPRETRRLWPVLVPAVVIVHVFLPGAIGGFRQSFFPAGGIVAEQTQLAKGADAQLAGGRIRQLKPMLAQSTEHPFFGAGYGTRIGGFNEPVRNAPILDNQWLGNILDVGYIGIAMWVWLFVRAARRLLRASRTATSEDDDWLFLGLAAPPIAFAVGMLTFDAFGFTQNFFVFWILLGLSAALLSITQPREAASLRPAQA
jgi:hypothetical protein